MNKSWVSWSEMLESFAAEMSRKPTNCSTPSRRYFSLVEEFEVLAQIPQKNKNKKPAVRATSSSTFNSSVFVRSGAVPPSGFVLHKKRVKTSHQAVKYHLKKEERAAGNVLGSWLGSVFYFLLSETHRQL